MNLEPGETKEGDGEATAAAGGGLAGGRALKVGAEERSNVWASLRDDKVVDIEELGDAGEGRFTVRVIGLAPGAEGDFLARGPGDNGAGFVLTFKDYGGVEGGRGGIGGKGSGPDKLRVEE